MKRAAVALVLFAVLAGQTGSAELEQPRWRSLGFFTVRAYCKCKKCCGKWAKYHTTTGGVDVYHWQPVVAVDPAVIRLGTPLWVGGVGARLASDTGLYTRGRRIEILMPGSRKVAHQHALRWGCKRREVWVQGGGVAR